MPTCNIYANGKDYQSHIEESFLELREFIAKELSCGDITLTAEEVSIRFMTPLSSQMIGKVEAEVIAHNFQERADQQDEFCRKLARKLEEILELDLQAVQCWLILSELGHSWEPA